MKVLVADDSLQVRVRLVALLRETGFEVVGEAEDGEAAVAQVAVLSPDAVVLDLHMPGLSGLDVLPLLKRAPSPPRVIVLTHDPSASYRARCLALGADALLDKATELERVLEVLASAVPA